MDLPGAYYNRFTKDDKYKRALYRAGYGLQSAELNEAHDYLHNEVQTLGECTFGDGSILNGGDVSFNSTSGKLNIKATKVLARGYIHELPEITYDISETETSFIGLGLTESIVNEITDATLRDPAVNTQNFNEPGSVRLKITPTWAKNTDETQPEYFYPLFEVEEGVLVQATVEATSKVSKSVENFVGRTIEDTHGSFVSSGLVSTFDKNTVIDGVDYHQLLVSKGKAYVDGYEVFQDFDKSVLIEQVTDYKSIGNEPVTCLDSKYESEDPWYTARWSPIRAVTEINGKRKYFATLTHGNYVGCTDLLPKLSSIAIEKVWQGDNASATGVIDSKITVTAVAGPRGNFSVVLLPTTEVSKRNTSELSNGFDKLYVWIQDGVSTQEQIAVAIQAHELVYTAVATTPSATWTLGVGTDTATLSGGTATTLYEQGTDFKLTADYVDWSLTGSEVTPYAEYNIIFTYWDTIDAVVSDDLKKLNISSFLDGETVNLDYTFYISRYDLLVIDSDGEFKIHKGTPSFINPVPPTTNVGLALNEMYLEYGADPIITSNRQIAYKESDIQAMFEDMEDIKYSIAQLTAKAYVSSTDPGTPKKNIFVDPFTDDTLRDMSQTQNAVVEGGTLVPSITWDVNLVNESDSILLDWSEVEAIVNTAYTSARIINELNFADIPPAKIVISPKTYRWVSETIYKNNHSWWWRWWWRSWWSSWWWGSRSTTTTSTTTTEINPATVDIPSISLKVTGGRFANEEEIGIYFDDILVATVTASATGTVDNSFNVPAGIKSGTKAVRAEGLTSGTLGFTTFTATPLRKTVTRTSYTNWWWSWWRYWDPLAQTFALDDDQYIASVDLIFTVAPTSYVDVAIVETQVGIPDNNKVLGTTRLDAEDITADGVSWSNFAFDLPVKISGKKEYAFMVLCPDNVASVRVAKMGDYDIKNNKWLTSQSYAAGVMLRSSNASTWESLQKEDLTFRINRISFSPLEKEILLDTISVTNKTDFVIITGSEADPGTKAEFTFTLKDRTPVESLSAETYSIVGSGNYTGDIDVSLTLTSDSDKLSPVVDGDISVGVGKIQFPATYIANGFPVDGDTFKVCLEVYEPTSSSVKVFYRDTQDGADPEWIEMSREDGGTVIDETFTDIPFTSDVGLMTNLTYTNIKIIMDSTDDDQRPVARNLRSYLI